MLRIKSIDDYGNPFTYVYDSVEELEKIWRSEDIDMDVPANDAVVSLVELDGKRMEIPYGSWFEDVLTMLGVDIWA